MRKPGLEVAKMFVNEKFPQCDFAILAGSASRGEETPTSDLDIIIFINDTNSFRESFVSQNWRIEVFVHNYHSYMEEFKSEKEKGRPVLGNMISEGIPLLDHKNYESVKQAAVNHVLEGPKRLTEDFIHSSRYFICDLLDDFSDAKDHQEALITINMLSLQVADFVLRYNNEWSGRGKGLRKALKRFDPVLNNEFFDSLDQFYVNHNKQPFVDFVNKVYEPVGGLLFEGYLLGKK